MPYQIEDKGSYLLISLSGRFDSHDLVLLLADVARIEESSISPPHRIITFPGITDFVAQHEELRSITFRRSNHLLPFDIKAGIVTTSPIEQGMARMWQSLIANPRITVRIFSSIEAAEAWISE